MNVGIFINRRDLMKFGKILICSFIWVYVSLGVVVVLHAVFRN